MLNKLKEKFESFTGLKLFKPTEVMDIRGLITNILNNLKL